MFILRDDKTLVEMRPAEFSQEEDFQELLERFPALLAGAQINNEFPRRWVLVAREMPVPMEEGGSGWWSADHLFLDQDGIPTIVEVKRQSDPRLRREVVAQMLDYAANGVAYWPPEEIKRLFEEKCTRDKLDPVDVLARLLDEGASIDRFWGRVKTNLQAGKIRMLFVADEIPPALRKIVEFLNQQMDPAEVLALELSLYEGEGSLRTLVPRLYGQTEEALEKKSVGTAQRNWDEQSIYQDMERRVGAQSVAVAKKLAQWINKHADQVNFGHGKVNGSMFATFIRGKVKFNPLIFSSSGVLQMNFGYCCNYPFDDVAKRLDWIARLKRSGGINWPETAHDKFPTLPLTVLADETRLNKFLEAMDWFVWELHRPDEAMSPLSRPITEETILEVGSEGGTIKLIGGKDESGLWRFWKKTNEETMRYMLDPEDLEGLEDFSTTSKLVGSLAEAFVLLSQYPWQSFVPLQLHPEFRDAILSEVERTGKPEDLKRWNSSLSRLADS